MSLGRTSKAQGTSRAPCSRMTNGLSTTEERRRHRALEQATTENNFPSCAGCGRAMLLMLLSLIEPCGQVFSPPSRSRFGKRLLSWRGCRCLTPSLPGQSQLSSRLTCSYLPLFSFLTPGALLAPDKSALTVCPLCSHSYTFSLLSLHWDTTAHNIMR